MLAEHPYNKIMIVLCFSLVLFSLSSSNKYSEDMNTPYYEKLKSLEKPFRMQKLNLMWEKAVKKVPSEKLKQLYSDLKYQDKEELKWKKLKAEGFDKDGMKEALLRGSFNSILEKYHLEEDFKTIRNFAYGPQDENMSPNDGYAKLVFRDKKLNKLWLKAEHQGFSDEQLNTLKEEFQHHQDKIDQYYHLINQVNKEPWAQDEPHNTLEQVLNAEEVVNKKYDHPHQVLKEKHSELKAGYDYLTQKIIPNAKDLEFEEPQVNTLWEMANNSTFSPEELESLRRELHHFEHRIRKLKTLTALELERDEESNHVDEEAIKRQRRIKDYNYKVEKIQKELATRILQRHTEL